MTTEPRYKSRSEEVRQSARARLAELRAARSKTSRRVAAAAPMAAERLDAAGAAIEDTVSSVLDAAAAVVETAGDAAMSASASARAFVDELVDAADAVPADEPPVTEAPASTKPSRKRPVRRKPTAAEPAAAETDAAPAPKKPATPKTRAAAAKAPRRKPAAAPKSARPRVEVSLELGDLPGAGPGLSWLLAEAGVRSFEELAAADADSLRQRLGVIGALLDLEGWIAHARDAVAARSGETA